MQGLVWKVPDLPIGVLVSGMGREVLPCDPGGKSIRTVLDVISS